MARSKKTERQIKDKRSKRFNYVGDKGVADKLQEIEFMPSSLETIDGAMLKFIDEELNLSTTTNDGFKKVPVLWVTAERAFQIKHNKDLRDKEETLKNNLSRRNLLRSRQMKKITFVFFVYLS